MYYRLVWPEVLIQRLAALYLVAKADGLANEFTWAMTTIEKALIESPGDEGESRSEDSRITIVPPLAITYRIDETVRAVYVVGIGYSPRR